MNVHVFIGIFKDKEAALAYTQESWEPEPGESATDAEYRAWEDSNPKWPMRDDLDCGLDHDFIETITEDDRFDYLKSVLKDRSAVERMAEELQSPGSVLVLIFEEALWADSVTLKSTSPLRYKGIFESTLK